MLFEIIVCLLLSVRNVLSRTGNIPANELLALENLYYSTNGSSWQWSALQSGVAWDFSQSNPNPCSDNWQGVACDCTPLLCTVTGLVLNSHRLVGQLPSDLGNLSNLSVLSLQFNGLIGILPSEMGQLSKLVTLDLRQNELEGTLPSWLSDLTSLSGLNLSSNMFNGTIPNSLWSLVNLSSLSLSNNNLFGTIPSIIFMFQNLSVLDLGRNFLEGTIPDQLQNDSKLQELTLNSNFLVSSIPQALCAMKEMRTLILAINRLRGTIPDCLGSLVNLHDLDLHANYLVGNIPSAIGNLTHFFSLNLIDNFLTGSIPWNLGTNPQLALLYLYGNLLSGVVPDSFRLLTRMSVLDLERNILLSGAVDDIVSDMYDLTYVALQQNMFTGSLPSYSWRRLVSYGVSNNFFTGNISAQLSKSPMIKYLFLGANLLSGTLDSSFSTAQLMTYFDVSENMLSGSLPGLYQPVNLLAQAFFDSNFFSGTIPSSLGSLPVLVELDLSNNRLTGTFPSALQSLSNLQILFLSNNCIRGSLDQVFNATLQRQITNVDVSHNQFSGTIPPDLFQSSSLESFATSANCLHGTIPASVCSAVALETLIMDGVSTSPRCRKDIFPGTSYTNAFTIRNALIGTIPSCVFSMPTLKSLHLGGNILTGSLPEVSASSPLISLSVSHNQLSGNIPVSLQQRTMNDLDLSYNRLGGVLDANLTVSPLQTQLYLQINRLSGKIPRATRPMLNVAILDGNIFECDVSRTELPRNDPVSDIYVCGSDAVNGSIYVWLALVALLSIAILFLVLHFARSNQTQLADLVAVLRNQWKEIQNVLRIGETDASQSPRQPSFSEQPLEVESDSITRLMRMFTAIRRLFIFLSCFLFVIYIPVYLGATRLANTYRHEYAWQVSAVLLNGPVAAITLIFSFFFVVAFFGYQMVRFFLILVPRHVVDDESQAESGLRKFCRIVLLLLINLTVMVAVDCAYVYVVLNYDGLIIALAQFSMAIFKIFWNESALWILVPLAKQAFASTMPAAKLASTSLGGHSSNYRASAATVTSTNNADDVPSTSSAWSIFRDSSTITALTKKDLGLADIRFLSFNTLLNNIIIPAVAIACVSSNCFYNAILASPTVTDTYVIDQCAVFIIDYTKQAATCSYQEPAGKTVTYDPPFHYSYQCASTIATTYSAVYIFMFTISGVIIPISKLALKYFAQRRADGWMAELVSRNLPWRFQHPKPEWEGHRFLIFHKGKFAVRVVSYLATILAYGSIFPPLGLIGCLSMVIITRVEELIIGSFILECDRKGLAFFRKELIKQCSGTLEYFRSSVGPSVPFACLILGFLVFDTMGYTEGAAAGLIAFALFYSATLAIIPVVAQGAYVWYRSNQLDGSRTLLSFITGIVGWPVVATRNAHDGAAPTNDFSTCCADAEVELSVVVSNPINSLTAPN